jgi:hypothetical protein
MATGLFVLFLPRGQQHQRRKLCVIAIHSFVGSRSRLNLSRRVLSWRARTSEHSQKSDIQNKKQKRRPLLSRQQSTMLVRQSFAVILLCTIAAADSATITTESSQPTIIITPQRVSFQDLLLVANPEYQSGSRQEEEGPHEVFWKALEKDGFVSLTNVFAVSAAESVAIEKENSKEAMMANLHHCAHSVGHSQRFADGSHRWTIAGHSLPGSISNNDETMTMPPQRLHPAMVPGDDDDRPTPNSSDCHAFETTSRVFRQRVDLVAHIVARLLDRGLAQQQGSIRTKTVSAADTDDSYYYESMQELVDQGEHLEHFHSYQKPNTETATATTTSSTKDHNNDPAATNTTTMDWHKDQGLFLLFTPGRFISNGELSRDLYVRSRDDNDDNDDGVIKLVQFSPDDDLVLLLGDGITQLLDGGNNNNQKTKLHVPWHSLSIAAQDDADEARVWYGRMVLPPADVIHEASGLSYGALRQRLNSAHNDNDDDAAVAAMGCSSSSMTTATARQLMSCSSAKELLCWHQCMAIADFGVNETYCNGLNLDLACVDPNNVVWDGMHADASAGYAPRCIALSKATTPTPPVNNATTVVATTNSTESKNSTTDQKQSAASTVGLTNLARLALIAISCMVVGLM